MFVPYQQVRGGLACHLFRLVLNEINSMQSFIPSVRIDLHNGAYALTYPAAMQIYLNKRKCLHKERVELRRDWFGTTLCPNVSLHEFSKPHFAFNLKGLQYRQLHRCLNRRSICSWGNGPQLNLSRTFCFRLINNMFIDLSKNKRHS